MASKITPAQVFGLIIGAIVFVQIISFGLSQVTDYQQLRLGPAFLFIAAGLGVYAIFGITNRYVDSRIFSKLDLVQVAMIAAAVVAIYVFLPKYVPEIFSAGVQSVRSALSMP